MPLSPTIARRTFGSFAAFVLSFGTVAIAQSSAPPFEANALRGYRAPGFARMSGTLVVAVAGSSPMLAPHARVIAVPDSAYTRWWFQTSAAALSQQSGPFRDAPDDRNLAPFVKTTYTDAMGNFHFAGLPAGAYRVRGRVDAKFDRVVPLPHPEQTVGMDGTTVVTTEVTTATVHDYSAFWLESGLVRLGQSDDRTIALHVAARRNIYGRR